MTQMIDYYGYDPVSRVFEEVVSVPITDPMPGNSVIDAPPENTAEWSRVGNEWVPTTPPAVEPEAPVQGELL